MEPSLTELFVRVDANGETGAGHLMRCLALAQRSCDLGEGAFFALSAETDRFVEKLQSEGIEVGYVPHRMGSPEDARHTVSLAGRRHAKWVVIDGYHFNDDFQRVLKDAGFKLLVIDDYGHARHYYADIVLNQNAHASIDLYSSREEYTQLLLGSSYVLLRREFLRRGSRTQDAPVVAKNILVTTGGGSWPELTAGIVRVLQNLRQDIQLLVVGEIRLPIDSLQPQIQAGKSVRLVDRIDDMSEAMVWADLSVSAAGSTCWELCFMGVPSLLFILSSNQEEIAWEADRHGAAINLGWANNDSLSRLAEKAASIISSKETRHAMTTKAQSLVDGKGAWRVLEAMKSATGAGLA